MGFFLTKICFYYLILLPQLIDIDSPKYVHFDQNIKIDINSIYSACDFVFLDKNKFSNVENQFTNVEKGCKSVESGCKNIEIGSENVENECKNVENAF